MTSHDSVDERGVALAPDDEIGGVRGALQHRDFMLFLGAAAISNGGNWMQLIAVQALLFELTGRGTWLGFFTFIMVVSAMLLTPYAGVLADRMSRRRILLATQSVQMCTSFGLLTLYLWGVVTPALVVLVGLLNGVATGFQTAAWQSFMPSLVPRSFLRHAIRVNSVQYTSARLLGPVAGAVALALGGIGAAIAANGVSFAVVIAMLLVVRPRHVPPISRESSVLSNLKAGLAHVWSRPSLRLAVQLSFFASMLGQSLQHVAAAIADGVYGRGGQANAGLLVTFGLGAMVSSVTMLTLGRRWRSSVQIVVAMAILALANALMASSDVFVLGQIAYFLVGVSQVQTAVSLNTVLQGTTADNFRGRVMSLYLLGILGGIAAGTQTLGTVGDYLGFRTTLAANSLAVVLLLSWLITRGRWRLMDGDPNVPVDIDSPLGADEHR